MPTTTPGLTHKTLPITVRISANNTSTNRFGRYNSGRLLSSCLTNIKQKVAASSGPTNVSLLSMRAYADCFSDSKNVTCQKERERQKAKNHQRSLSVVEL